MTNLAKLRNCIILFNGCPLSLWACAAFPPDWLWVPGWVIVIYLYLFCGQKWWGKSNPLQVFLSLKSAQLCKLRCWAWLTLERLCVISVMALSVAWSPHWTLNWPVINVCAFISNSLPRGPISVPGRSPIKVNTWHYFGLPPLWENKLGLCWNTSPPAILMG